MEWKWWLRRRHGHRGLGCSICLRGWWWHYSSRVPEGSNLNLMKKLLGSVLGTWRGTQKVPAETPSCPSLSGLRKQQVAPQHGGGRSRSSQGGGGVVAILAALLPARHCARSFTHLPPFHGHSWPKRWIFMCSFDRWRPCRPSDLPSYSTTEPGSTPTNRRAGPTNFLFCE